MATVTIGGKEHHVPTPYNFRKIKRAWPHMARAANAEGDPMQAVDSIIAIIAIGLLPAKFSVEDLTEDQRKVHDAGDMDALFTMRLAAKMDEIEEELLGPEVPGLKDAALEVMRENGLLRVKDGVVEGNDPASPESPSTETSTELSQNSSLPDAPAVIGTE